MNKVLRHLEKNSYILSVILVVLLVGNIFTPALGLKSDQLPISFSFTNEKMMINNEKVDMTNAYAKDIMADEHARLYGSSFWLIVGAVIFLMLEISTFIPSMKSFAKLYSKYTVPLIVLLVLSYISSFALLTTFIDKTKASMSNEEYTWKMTVLPGITLPLLITIVYIVTIWMKTKKMTN